MCNVFSRVAQGWQYGLGGITLTLHVVGVSWSQPSGTHTNFNLHKTYAAVSNLTSRNASAARAAGSSSQLGSKGTRVGGVCKCSFCDTLATEKNPATRDGEEPGFMPWKDYKECIWKTYMKNDIMNSNII